MTSTKMMVKDVLGVSTIGTRSKRAAPPSAMSSTTPSTPSSHLNKQQQQQQQEKQGGVVLSLLKRLESDSRFFESNQPYTLPNFTQSEIELNRQLGQGEYGIVFDISAIHVPDECLCPKCQPKQQQQQQQVDNKQKDDSMKIDSTAFATSEKQVAGVPGNNNNRVPKAPTSAALASSHGSSATTSSDGSLIQRKSNHAALFPPILDINDKNTEKENIDDDDGGPILPQQLQPKSPPPPPPSSIKHRYQNKHSSSASLHRMNNAPRSTSGSTAGEAVAAGGGGQQQHRHRRVTSHISFAEDIKDDDDSTLSTESDHDDYGLDLSNLYDDDTDGEAAFLRGYMSTHVFREGRPRYAVKRLKKPQEDNNNENDTLSKYVHKKAKAGHSSLSFPSTQHESEYLFQAAVDLATEAKFLASIRHPNIVKMRGTVGTPGCYDFMIVMDCLVMTLRDKMTIWRQEKQQNHKASSFLGISGFNIGGFGSGGGGGPLRRMLFNNHHQQPQTDALSQDQHGDKLLAVYDIARAMRYLHNQHILFRDLKPENVAFDVRGDMRLFDFGLAKELKQRDLKQPPDGFNATGLTGSRRYMAPEVVQCKNYGLSADVYSYSIVFWEVFSTNRKGEVLAYPKMDLNQHFEHVVLKHKRPNKKRVSKLLSKQLQMMMVNMWAPDPLERPNFKSICEQLGAECVLMNASSTRSGQSQLSDRTNYLMNRSLKSQCAAATIE